MQLFYYITPPQNPKSSPIALPPICSSAHNQQRIESYQTHLYTDASSIFLCSLHNGQKPNWLHQHLLRMLFSQSHSLKSRPMSFEKLLLPSTIVSRMPPICSFGFSWRFTLFTVFKSCSNPFTGRKCACTGIITLSAAVKAFSVIIPKEGEQSIKM